MDPSSPPKRMTRARAAAAAGTTKPTKIITAAAKAKAAGATASTAAASMRSTTATKRKTRADDHDESADELVQPAMSSSLMRSTRSTRAKSKKVSEDDTDVEETARPASRASRTTRSKTPVPEPAEEPVKRPRGRPRKIIPSAEENKPEMSEPANKTTRTRAAASTATKPAAAKKTVTFQVPEKENIAPPSAKDKTATAAATGMRAHPVRRAGAVAARGTRGAPKVPAQTDTMEEKRPLSPKKVTQMPVSYRDVSEDELAGSEKTPLKPMMRSPMKLPSAAIATPKPKDDDSTVAVNNAILNPPELTSTLMMGSPARRLPAPPYKDAMRSPARRVDSMPLFGEPSGRGASASGTSSAAPFKSSLLNSPAKRPQSPIKSLGLGTVTRADSSTSPLKASLLQSPAKRPVSAIKPFALSTHREGAGASTSPVTRPAILSTPRLLANRAASPEDSPAEESLEQVAGECENAASSKAPALKFPGRLSAVFPRHADPGLEETSVEDVEEDDSIELLETDRDPSAGIESGDPMSVDEPDAYGDDEPLSPASDSTTPPNSPPKQAFALFGLRQKDLQPFNDEDSEDELTSSIQRHPYGRPSYFGAVPGTPTPLMQSRTPNTGAQSSRSREQKTRVPKIGYTPLAQQLDAWSASTPARGQETPSAQQLGSRALLGTEPHAVGESPVKNSFFEDEMVVRPETDMDPTAQTEIEAAVEADITAQIEDPIFNDVPITDEDVALAAEANEMSLLEPEQIEDLVHPPSSPDDSLSEASQEYGDENQIPIDPALLGNDARDASLTVPPVTPARVLSRTFHTTTKVPLKPADDSTPRTMARKRSKSISRLPVPESSQRPHSLTRNATVISYSPSKGRRMEGRELVEASHAGEQSTSAPATPAKSDVWSTMGTPARTPRRDMDASLLKGAVVYCDVYTNEGADASAIFVELLTQMGARCVKDWRWNPSSPTNAEFSASKIGITHVVYKDGGKRTLEKVRESAGVVQCVGVSWVLDCERENKWLDEAPYYIDTSCVPRGGARRRKSMEPKALANLNGMIVSSPVKGGRESHAPKTPMNRRDSTVWMRTPPEQLGHDIDAYGEEEEGNDWQDMALLTPVPKTPAPEAIAHYAANIMPETPSVGEEEDQTRHHLLMQTCPPASRVVAASPYAAMGHGVLREEKDQQVMMRLMAARRKSLQYAPKVGSPLSKTWSG